MQPDPVWYFPAPHHVQLISSIRPDPNKCLRVKTSMKTAYMYPIGWMENKFDTLWNIHDYMPEVEIDVMTHNLIQSGTSQQCTVCSWPQQSGLIQKCAHGFTFPCSACVCTQYHEWLGKKRHAVWLTSHQNTTWKGYPVCPWNQGTYIFSAPMK